MAVKICITGGPMVVEIITRDLRHVYRVVAERDEADPDNAEHIRRYVTIATERPGEFGSEPAEGFNAVHDAG